MQAKLTTFFDEIVFRGNLYLPIAYLKKALYAFVLGLAVSLTINKSIDNLGQLALIFLSIAIFIRPLAAVFPTFGIFKTLLAIRRQIGVSCGIFTLGHVLAQTSPLNPFPILFAAGTGPKSFLFWGFLAFLTLIPMLLTSNDLSVRLLKQNWKKIHLLIHPFYIFVLIHRGLQIGYFGLIQAIFIIGALYTLRYLARINKQFLVNLTSFNLQRTI